MARASIPKDFRATVVHQPFFGGVPTSLEERVIDRRD
jgi:hypothetical protein